MNPGLTSFRALAFLAVFFFHAGWGPGYLGVQAFFVLSGFLLTPIMVSMKENMGGKDFFIRFYGRRSLRIFPLYYMYLLVLGLLSWVIINMEGINPIERMERFLEQLPWALTYTYNFYHASEAFEHTHLLTHFWSLAVEEQFYLVWPLVVFLVPTKRLKTVLLVCIAMGPLIRWGLVGFVGEDPMGLFYKRMDFTVYVLPFSHIDAFAMGGFFALFGKAKPGNIAWLYIAAVILLGYATDYAVQGKVEWVDLGYGPFMMGKEVWGFSVANWLFAYLLLQIKGKYFLTPFFENKVLEYLGTISYGLYVFHFGIMWAVSSVVAEGSLVHTVASLVLTVAVSAASYEFYEKRFIQRKDSMFPKNEKDKGKGATPAGKEEPA